MIQPTVAENTGMSLGFDSQKAKISDSSLPFIFDTLSAHLYSRPYESVMRELVSNMKDAHVRANKQLVPCLVKYNNKTKSIHFIDQGTGLSVEKMETVYNDWGNSESRENDALLGMYGLGSKSPFSITNVFYINTYWEGTYYTYSYVKEKGKLPLLTLLDSIKKEGCGTEIWFYTDHYDEFKVAANSELRYFTNVIVENLEYNNKYRIIRGKNFIINTSSTYDGVEICFGECRYVMDWSALGRKKIHSGFALYFDIDAPIFPNPSRESLQMTDEAIRYINDKLDEVLEELKILHGEQYASIENFLEYLEVRSNPRVLKISGHPINISGIIQQPKVSYKYIGHIRPDIEVSTLESLWRSLKNRWYYGVNETLNLNDDLIYLSVEGEKMSRTKALNGKWKAIVTPKKKEEIEAFSHHGLAAFFKDDVYSKKHVLDDEKNIVKDALGYALQVLHNPLNIDPVEEIYRFQTQIISDLKTKWKDYDSIVPIKRTRSKGLEWDKKTQILAWYSSDGSIRSAKTLEELSKVKKIILCETEEEYTDVLNTLRTVHWAYKSTKHYSLLYLGMRVSASQMKKTKGLTNFITYEQFYKEEGILKFFTKCYFRAQVKNVFALEPSRIPYIGQTNKFAIFNNHLEKLKKSKVSRWRAGRRIELQLVSVPSKFIPVDFLKPLEQIRGTREHLLGLLNELPITKKEARRELIIPFLIHKLSKYETNQAATGWKKHQL